MSYKNKFNPVVQNFHGLADSELKSLFVLNDITVHNLRTQAFKLNIPKPHTDLLNIFMYIGLVNVGIPCLHISVNLHHFLYLSKNLHFI